MQWGDEPFHDGSATYLPDPPQQVGDDFDVLLRVPRSSGITRVVVRQVHDAEPVAVEATLDSRTDTIDWYRATLTQHHPVLNYRFLTDGGPNSYRWITAAGTRDHDPPDAGDFRTSIHAGAPDWAKDAVAYQVFPDRFARGSQDPPLRPPAWARRATSWDEPPVWKGPDTPRHLYGGTLTGVAEHLDHIEALGATLLYLTPFFPAPSNHRYNAAGFDRVDPLLGGDAALAALTTAAHARDIRVIGDITTNHTGSHHDWFRAAQADPHAAEVSYYHFAKHPDDYVGWMGSPTLPKLDHRSPALRERLITGRDSPVRRFLRAPFDLDGWRVDVGNMTGRYREIDENHAVARHMRAAIAQELPDGYLVGEHFHDHLGDLDGDGWQGVMNYAGFAKPLWMWLTDGDIPVDEWLGIPWPGWPHIGGRSMVEAMRAFSAVSRQHLDASMTLVASHDTPRIRTIAGGDPRRVEVAVAAMMTMPGLPMVWSGDEVGLRGVTGEDARRTFDWEHPERWDRRTLQAYRSLIQLRHEHEVLRSGSMRWLHAGEDQVVYTREDRAGGVLVLLARSAGPEIRLPIAQLGLRPPGHFDSLYSDASVLVEEEMIRLPGDGPGVAIWRY